jgi:hypothetical protein
MTNVDKAALFHELTTRNSLRLMLLAVADEVEWRVEEIMEMQHGVTPPSHAAAGATRNGRSDRC